jgi:aspartate-semialdehyde dehydrogenase
MNAPRVAIIGATGLVGETLLRVMDERRFAVAELFLFATIRSAGVRTRAFDRTLEVLPISQGSEPDFSSFDLVFFAAGSDVSLALAPKAVAAGATVIDKSTAFRLHPDVALVVPEVNPQALRGHKLIANPNCAVIPLAVMLGPIRQRFGLQWVSVSTYQSVSGAGKDALQEFERQLAGDASSATALPHRIAGNIFPENGAFDEAGDGEEERKIAAEFKKILDDDDVRVSATSVRVPVAVCHGEAVAFQTQRPATRDEIAQTLRSAAGVTFLDGAGYATPLQVQGSDEVVVGRLRADAAHPGAFLAWLMSDNLRKGAATNALQIAEVALATNAGARAADSGVRA